MATDKIVLQIEVDERGIKSSAGNIEGVFDKLGQNIGKNFGAGIGTAISGLTASFLGLGAAVGGAFAFKELISAGAEAEASINKLNQALRSAGVFSASTSDEFRAYATQIQATTTINDEHIQSLLSLSLTYAKTTDQAKEITSAAIELSAALGVDLETATKQLGQSLDGTAGRLGELVPQLKTLTAEQLKSGEALRVVQERFGGSAQAQTQTYTGSITQLKNAFGEVTEQLGLFIVQQPLLTSAIKSSTKFFQDITQSLDDFKNSGKQTAEGFSADIRLTENRIKSLRDQLDALSKAGFNSQNLFDFTSKQAELDKLTNRVKQLDDQNEKLFQNELRRGSTKTSIGLGGPTQAEIAQQVGFQKELDQSRLQGANLQIALLQAVRDQSNASEIDEALANERRLLVDQQFQITKTGLEEQFRSGQIASQDQFNALVVQSEINKNLQIAAIDEQERQRVEANQAFTRTKIGNDLKSLAGTTAQLSTKITNTFGVGIAGAFEKFGAALATGKNAFAEFGKALIGILGDMAIQYGTFLLLSGLGGLFVSGGASASSIPFGIALIALGGALKALSGGGVGGPSPGGVPGAGQTSPQANDISGGFSPVQSVAEPQSRVTVNVDGALDARSVGLQIAQILQDISDTNAAELRFS